MADLDSHRIAAAGMVVADELGVAGFTMRKVAEKLGVSPMALYHYVEDKAALVALVLDAAITEMPLPAPTGNWRDEMFALAKWMRDSTRAHPALSELRRTYHVWTPSMLLITERWLSLWQQSGLDLDAAVEAAAASSLAIVGVVAEELSFQRMRTPRDQVLTALPNARLVFSTPYNYDRGFELIVRATLDGLHSRLAKPQQRKEHRPGRTNPRSS